MTEKRKCLFGHGYFHCFIWFPPAPALFGFPTICRSPPSATRHSLLGVLSQLAFARLIQAASDRCSSLIRTNVSRNLRGLSRWAFGALLRSFLMLSRTKKSRGLQDFPFKQEFGGGLTRVGRREVFHLHPSRVRGLHCPSDVRGNVRIQDVGLVELGGDCGLPRGDVRWWWWGQFLLQRQKPPYAA